MLLKSTNHLLYFSLICLLLLIQACDEGIFESGIEEGKIEYTISYPDIPSDSYMQDFLPKKAETYFNKYGYRTDIIAAMGLFKTSIIKDKENLIHSVKVLNKKLASELSEQDISLLNPEFQDITIKKMLEFKGDIFPDYTQDNFEKYLLENNKIISKGVVSNSGRTIYEYKRI